MEIKDLIKKYSEGKTDKVMWAAVDVFTEFIEDKVDPKDMMAFKKKLYYSMVGGHYDEYFAKEQVSHMSYVYGNTRYTAPYWSDDEVKNLYGKHRDHLAGINMWDFYVTLHWVKSTFCPMLQEWFPGMSAEEYTHKLADLALYWLNADDVDGPEKVWCYFNPV